MKALFIAALLAVALVATPRLEASEPLVFESEEQAERFRVLSSELRCLVCQNQTLADSDAELAHDLRQEIFNMMQAGRSNEEIKTFMVERYGDFVLYSPPIGGNTLLLWFMPALLLLAGGTVLVVRIRKLANSGALAAPGDDHTEEDSPL